MMGMIMAAVLGLYTALSATPSRTRLAGDLVLHVAESPLDRRRGQPTRLVEIEDELLRDITVHQRAGGWRMARGTSSLDLEHPEAVYSG